MAGWLRSCAFIRHAGDGEVRVGCGGKQGELKVVRPSEKETIWEKQRRDRGGETETETEREREGQTNRQAGRQTQTDSK